MGIDIIQVRSGRDLRRFIRLPWQLYEGDPNWVAPLISDEHKRFNPKKNPFFEHAEVQLFLALSNGRPVGRISAHIDHLHNEFHGEKTGFFGFFEAPNDSEVAKALLKAAEEWLSSRGMELVRGPMSFNSNDLIGLLVEGFERPPAIMMPYNPPYYAELIEDAGYKKAKDLFAYTITIDEGFRATLEDLRPRLEAISQRARRKGFTVRPVNLKDFDGEVKRLMEIYNEAWERNWGFVPLTEKEFIAQAKGLKKILIPQLAVIVELGGEPVGFGVALPDFNQAIGAANGRLLPFGIIKLLWRARRIDGLRLLTLGIKRKYRVRGVDALIYLELLRAGLSLPQYKWCECSWILEDNLPMIRALELVESRPSKVYRVYEKPLGEGDAPA